MCQNAVALQENMELALGLLLNPLERRSAEGQLADSHDDFAVETQLIKPPIHGWALLQIMKRHDIAREWPMDKIRELYDGLGPWADWFMNYRDDDGDGLPTLDHGDETGLDDSTMFLHHLQLTTRISPPTWSSCMRPSESWPGSWADRRSRRRDGSPNPRTC